MTQPTDRMQGRNIIVTGGTGALGRAVVSALLEEGAICHVPRHPDHPSSESDVGWARADHVTITDGIDLCDESACRAYFEGIASTGPIWASIHVAGGFDMGPITETTLERYEKLMSMNARSCFLSCREAARHMKSAGVGGRIVNVAAMPGLEPRRGGKLVAYSASKAAVAAITQALATELAGESIWVNAVAPSIMDTPANREAMPNADHDSWAKVDEVGRTIVFLASPDNAVTTGAIVPVTGRG